MQKLVQMTAGLLALGLNPSFVSVAHAGLEVLPATPPVPADNPITPAKVALGKKLYNDKLLSKDKTISCNSCHNVAKGGEDNKAFSPGVGGKLGGRSAPTVFNAAFLSVQFWDGRAASLEDQAKGPMINPVEMAMPDHDAVVARLKEVPEYVAKFKEAFGSDGITIDRAAQAIATFERTLITPDAPVDKFLKGDKKALSASAQNGMKLVETVGCTSCHSGPNYAGPQLPQGTGFYQKFPTYPGSEYEAKYGLTKDLGRFEATKKDADKGFWRVPTWRNIALTAPYFHNGSVKALDEAVRVMAKTQLNKELSPSDVKDIVEFLKGLTGRRPSI